MISGFLRSSFIIVSSISVWNQTIITLTFNTLYESKLIISELSSKYKLRCKESPGNFTNKYSRKRKRLLGVINTLTLDKNQLINDLYGTDVFYELTRFNSIFVIKSSDRNCFLEDLLDLADKNKFKVIELVGRGFSSTYVLL